MNTVAQKCFDRSCSATAQGDTRSALRWLEQAHLLSGENHTIALSLAGMRAIAGHSGCIELFQRVAHECDVALAWLGLASAYHAWGHTQKAASALAQVLSRHALPAELDYAALTEITEAAKEPGWCGLTGTGELLIARSRDHVTPEISALLDDEQVALEPVSADQNVVKVLLPLSWHRAQEASVSSGSKHLLGSAVNVARVVRVEGFVPVEDGGLEGWAWCPGRPDQPCKLLIESVRESRTTAIVEASDESIVVARSLALARPRRIRVSAEDLSRFDGPVRVKGLDGKDLYGSPLDPSAARRSATAAVKGIARLFPGPHSPTQKLDPVELPSIPATLTALPARGRTRPRPVDVVIPVYKGKVETLACLRTVIRSLPSWAQVIVVDDCSPEPELVQALDDLRATGQIEILRQTVNGGFTSAANAGMWLNPHRDVLLLNSDTLVPRDWLRRLRTVAYSTSDVGTVTPFSNDATIFSYPSTEHPNSVPDIGQTEALAEMAWRANGAASVTVPTGVGFCMYIRRDCLDSVGGLREDVFAQGYGEENDFCIRARHLGWRHVAATGIFVAHVGGRSFGTAKGHLIERNLKILNSLHPGYDELIRSFEQHDPLADARRNFDMARWREGATHAGSVLLVTHGRSGGVQTRVRARAVELREEGLRPIVVWPVENRFGGRDCVLGNGPEGGTPNLRFRVPEELTLLARFLRSDHLIKGEIHSLIGHDHQILELFSQLDLPYEMIVHDYSTFCPRITLVGQDRYCGEPDTSHCEACVADNGVASDETIALQDLRARSRRELLGAERVIAPSVDAASRLRRHFPELRPEVMPWEPQIDPSQPLPIHSGSSARVCLVGAIGAEKGYNVLLDCARDATRRSLDLEFVLVGFSMDDNRLLDTDRIRITGRYEEVDVVSLIRAQEADIGFVSSIWPETWSYTLSQLWQAGLDVAAFNLGAPAERIRRAGRGWLMPLGLGAGSVNDALLTIVRSRRRMASERSHGEHAAA